MRCDHCGGPLRVYGFQVQRSKVEPQRVTCERCGSSHSMLAGSTSAINPRPLPLGAAGSMPINMPWRDARTRPIDAGKYECRFTDVEPRRLVLDWDGRHFCYQGQRVSMRTFLAWRGEWKA